MLGTIGVTPDIALAFATPVLKRTVLGHEQAGPELAKAVRAARERDPGVAVSNAGGWQSQPDLWTWAGPALDWYRAAVDDAVRRVSALLDQIGDLSAVEVDYEASAWANINRAGDYNRIHIHPTAHWAVVYYVETGAADPARPGSGQIELFDPRPLALTARSPPSASAAAWPSTRRPACCCCSRPGCSTWCTPTPAPANVSPSPRT